MIDDKDIKYTIGKEFKIFLLDRYISLAEAARRIGCHVTTLSNITNGKLYPGQRMLHQIKKFMNVDENENISCNEKIGHTFTWFPGNKAMCVVCGKIEERI